MRKITSTVAIIGAFFASACCFLPLLFAGVAGIAVVAATFAKLRLIFLIIVVLTLGYAFYVVYFKKAQTCEEGEICATPQGRKRQKWILWIITLFALVMTTFPTWIQWF